MFSKLTMYKSFEKHIVVLRESYLPDFCKQSTHITRLSIGTHDVGFGLIRRSC